MPTSPPKPFAFTVARHGYTDQDHVLEPWVGRARTFVALDAAFLTGAVSVATAASHRSAAPRQAAALVAEYQGIVASIHLDARSAAERNARLDEVIYPLVRDLQQIQARGKARA